MRLYTTVRTWVALTIGAAAVLPGPEVLADTLLVPAEYPAIQAAIDAAVDGDIVEIADGTYVGPGNKNLDFGGKAITVRSVSRDPALCIIDCGGDGRGFYFHSAEETVSIVEGLTITNGGVESNPPPDNHGGGVYCHNSSPTITDCIISASTAYLGGGIYCAGSSPAINNCTIGGNSAGSQGGGIYCGSNSSPTISQCIISDNSAIASGYGWGGGVRCAMDSNPTITDCTLAGNSADDGGGINCLTSAPTLTNCIISGNSCTDDGGGAHCYNGSAASFTDCTFAENTAGDDGGGVYCQLNSDIALSHCTIRGNSAQNYGGGGGIYCLSTSPTISNCTIRDNEAGSVGGGIECWDGTPAISNCTISGNVALYGGGCRLNSSSPDLFNCLVSGNSASRGGGIYCRSSSNPYITNCTFTENSAGISGGSIYCFDNSSPRLTNCILWANSPQEIHVDSGSPVVSYCDVQGGWSGAGNIDADPLCSGGPGGCFYLSQTVAGLPFVSPCVDAGSATAASLGLDSHTTRRDEVGDTGLVDLGYHYPITGQPYLPGDINRDGDRDLDDFEPFATVMTGPGPLPAGTITGCLTAGDMDDDGDLDVCDFAAFTLVFDPPIP